MLFSTSSKGSDSFWFIIEDSPQTRQISLKHFHYPKSVNFTVSSPGDLIGENKNPWGTLQSDLENAQQQREDLMQAGPDGFMYDTHGR